MARPLRIEFPGGLFHVTSRGDRRENIYLSDDDRVVWLDIVGAVCKRFNWACHAWCQMDNHYHLLIETPEGNLSQGMRQLNGVYTQYINRTHQRVGHVFQGRYKAILVQKDAYLLELARYVVLNPVRAGVVKRPEQWAWSSHRALLGKADRPAWLHTDWILGQFGQRRGRAVEKYEDFVRAGVGLPSLWENLRHQIYLGNDDFIDRLQRKLPKAADLGEIPRSQRRPRPKSLTAYAAAADRNRAIAQAYRSGGYTMKQIAEHFGLHYATVSRVIKAEEG
ncbi:MAG: transposase [Burkholderiales bacterium]|nr:transposase [Burkholderiales bacterium]